MFRSLKHLNALRAFEASARLGNFTRAAEELGVTPAAVGQQVRMLEDALGRRLFHRTPGGLRATTAATLALADLHDGFERLEAGLARLLGPVGGAPLSVSLAPALSWKWLAPRLQGLYALCPHMDLRMNATLRLADIKGGEFDMALRYGAEEPDGLTSTLLFEEYTIPVCTPTLCPSGHGSKSTAWLLEQALLHIEGETSDAGVVDWRGWGRHHGLDDKRLDRGARYPQSAMALQAVQDGQGVLLCGLTLVIDDLIAERLVTPLGPGIAVKTDYDYRLVSAPRRWRSAIETIFKRWIEQEAETTRADIAAFARDIGLELTEQPIV